MFQIFLLVLILGILVIGFRKGGVREGSWLLKFFWAGFWLIAATIVLKPELTTRAAQFVGIGRGADLVLYIGILVLTALVFTLLFWVDSIEESVTKLAQHIALKEYEQREAKKSSDSDPNV